MECSKCHKTKDISNYSIKNVKDNIYYQYCNDCRNYVLSVQKKYKEAKAAQINPPRSEGVKFFF